jgi:hypothetical protein
MDAADKDREEQQEAEARQEAEAQIAQKQAAREAREDAREAKKVAEEKAWKKERLKLTRPKSVHAMVGTTNYGSAVSVQKEMLMVSWKSRSQQGALDSYRKKIPKKPKDAASGPQVGLGQRGARSDWERCSTERQPEGWLLPGLAPTGKQLKREEAAFRKSEKARKKEADSAFEGWLRDSMERNPPSAIKAHMAEIRCATPARNTA